jgi:ATP-binding cassette subfamily F protein 3
LPIAFRAKGQQGIAGAEQTKQIDRMEKIDAPLTHEKTVSFRFPQPPRSGHRVIKLENVDFAYGDLPVYRGLNFEAERNQRTVLVGQTARKIEPC